MGGNPDRQGIDPVTSAPYARLHPVDFRGEAGVLYEAGTPMIVFRNATGTMGGQYAPLSITGRSRRNSASAS